jgi:hypothetical protein
LGCHLPLGAGCPEPEVGHLDADCVDLGDGCCVQPVFE